MLAMLPAPPPALAPTAVGRADGWGLDDFGTVSLAVACLLLAVALIGSFAPRHGGRVSRWRIFGRPPKWVAMITAVLDAGMGVFLIQGVTDGELLQGSLVGLIVAATSLTSSVLLIVGWWVRRLHHWLHNGMGLAAITWAGIAAANLNTGITVSGFVAACITGLLAVTWVTEVTDDGGRAPGER